MKMSWVYTIKRFSLTCLLSLLVCSARGENCNDAPQQAQMTEGIIEPGVNIWDPLSRRLQSSHHGGTINSLRRRSSVWFFLSGNKIQWRISNNKWQSSSPRRLPPSVSCCHEALSVLMKLWNRDWLNAKVRVFAIDRWQRCHSIFCFYLKGNVSLDDVWMISTCENLMNCTIYAVAVWLTITVGTAFLRYDVVKGVGNCYNVGTL